MTFDEPISYRGADGQQYIAVRSVPRDRGSSHERLLIFAPAHQATPGHLKPSHFEARLRRHLRKRS